MSRNESLKYPELYTVFLDLVKEILTSLESVSDDIDLEDDDFQFGLLKTHSEEVRETPLFWLMTEELEGIIRQENPNLDIVLQSEGLRFGIGAREIIADTLMEVMDNTIGVTVDGWSFDGSLSWYRYLESSITYFPSFFRCVSLVRGFAAAVDNISVDWETTVRKITSFERTLFRKRNQYSTPRSYVLDISLVGSGSQGVLKANNVKEISEVTSDLIRVLRLLCQNPIAAEKKAFYVWQNGLLDCNLLYPGELVRSSYGGLASRVLLEDDIELLGDLWFKIRNMEISRHYRLAMELYNEGLSLGGDLTKLISSLEALTYFKNRGVPRRLVEEIAPILYADSHRIPNSSSIVDPHRLISEGYILRNVASHGEEKRQVVENLIVFTGRVLSTALRVGLVGEDLVQYARSIKSTNGHLPLSS